MLTTGEKQELCQIGQELRDADRGFAWRLTLLPGLLRWAGPGRQGYLLILAALAAGLLRLAAAAGRLLTHCARAALDAERTTAMILGDTAWLGWEPGRAPDHRASPLRDRPQARGRDRR
jgi:hypothetical protein